MPGQHHTVSPNLQQQQLHGPLRGGGDQLQGLPAAAVLQGGLQQAHHRVVVAGLEEPLDLLQRLTALQGLQPLLDLSTEEEREGESPCDETGIVTRVPTLSTSSYGKWTAFI